jgi:predicted nucleotidyltransferase component of viral defense system
LKKTLSAFGTVRIRSWGDVDSVELQQDGRTVFSFQVARRSAHLEEPISAGWIEVPLDSLADLVSSKMVALVERGAPRDFLDIYTLCQAGLLSVADCWALWRRQQTLGWKTSPCLKGRR